MKIAFLHYHFNPGGVTTVIRQQMAALEGKAEILLLTGIPAPAPVPVSTAVIAGIGYDPPARHAAAQEASPERIAEQIFQAIRKKWPDGCDLLHVHNPLLAKNHRFLSILARLQQMGVRLLLQIHDFAEDGRPGAYYAGAAYPEDCHYCVINSRDQSILLRSGLAPEGVHLLSNMVNAFNPEPEKRLAEEFVLYPVRAIRRKNIGEAILLSLFFPAAARLAVTLPPNTRRDQIPYDNWRAFVKINHLGVVFEAGSHYDFNELVKSAQCLITTSISEGFGFAFLEPWTAGQLLSGRNLPAICRDFEENGVRLDHLYERLAVPLTAFDERMFFAQWQACLRENALRFGLEMESAWVTTRYREITSDGCIDFGLLNEAFQQQVISRAIADPGIRRAIINSNPALKHFTDVPDRADRIAGNREAVLAAYNQSAYRNRLLAIYRKVAGTRVRQRIDKTRLAAEFLRPEAFSLLQWSGEGL